MDAIEFKGNGTVENSEIVILQYPSKYEEGKFTYHIAPYKLIGTSTIHIYNEGNYEKCKKTERDISIDDDNILGFFDYELWLEIKKLPIEAINTLKCENNFKQYNSDGSISRGPAGEWGIGQFMKGTWSWITDVRRANDEPEILMDIMNPYDQIRQMKYMWDMGLQEHWNAYKDTTCYQNLLKRPIVAD